MARKSKTIANEVIEARRILEERTAQLNKEVEEETQFLNSIEGTINNMANENSLFIGVILGREDILTILKIHMETGEEVKIPVKVYFDEKRTIL